MLSLSVDLRLGRIGSDSERRRWRADPDQGLWSHRDCAAMSKDIERNQLDPDSAHGRDAHVFWSRATNATPTSDAPRGKQSIHRLFKLRLGIGLRQKVGTVEGQLFHSVSDDLAGRIEIT